MIVPLWLGSLLRRRRSRLLAIAACIATAVALLGSLASFVASAESTMTTRSIARVGIDWQVTIGAGANTKAAVDTIRADPEIRTALPVGYATTTGFEATTNGTTQTTAAGIVLGLPPAYGAAFPLELRPLLGSTEGVLLSQQTAANLHATPGDRVTIGRAGLGPVSVRVDGIVDLPLADSLFQIVGAPAGSQPVAPPDNVLVMPDYTWHRLFDPLAVLHPDQVHMQVHATVNHALPSTPADAFTTVQAAARNLEVRLAGAGRVGDNLGVTLDSARLDAQYSQLLFLFLGLPGAVVAVLCAAAAARAGADRRRSEQGLLRTRGASTAQLVRLATADAVLTGGIGSGVGVAGALAVSQVAVGTTGVGSDPRLVIGALAVAVLLGMLAAVAVIALPAWRDARRLTVRSARREVSRRPAGRPAVLVASLLLLATAGLVDFLTLRAGYELVVAPEGVPTVSVNTWTLLGPVALWVGGAIGAWWIVVRGIGAGRRQLRRLLGRVFGPVGVAAANAVVNRRALPAVGAALVATAVAFAISTSVFDATYAHQSEVDARLTNGGDVTVTVPPTATLDAAIAGRLDHVHGVATVEPLQHRYAYVGADLQDLFGVRPDTVVAGAGLQNPYFTGGTAQQVIDRLRSTPDGVLVSAETVKDYALTPGDHLTLRLRDRVGGAITPVTFHYVGIVNEFPTAPRDSFLVANAAYLARATGSDVVSTFLISTDGTAPHAVADRVRAITGGAATVSDIESARLVVGSSLTAVDLGGLTRLELAFAIGLACAAGGVVLGLGLAERRKTLAVVSALGGRPRDLMAFQSAELGLVVAGGAALGALLGTALSVLLVTVLTGVFDPPPASLTVPWGYVGAVGGALVAAAVTATWLVARSSRLAGIAALRE